MSINPTSGTIGSGGSITTAITTDGDGTKSCTTSSSSVATCSVSGNTVTINGLATGSATITVKQTQGTNYNAATDKTYSVTVVPLQPKYFAFGNPTTSSTTNYTSVGKTVFGTLYNDNISKGVCIIRNNTLQCFKSNNWSDEQNHIQQVFSDKSCYVSSSTVSCSATDFRCFVYNDKRVGCYIGGTNDGCTVNYEGIWECNAS